MRHPRAGSAAARSPCRARQNQPSLTHRASVDRAPCARRYECPINGSVPSYLEEEHKEAMLDARKPLGKPGSAKWERQQTARKNMDKKRFGVRLPWSKKKGKAQPMV
jgi:hypothetical protein